MTFARPLPTALYGAGTGVPKTDKTKHVQPPALRGLRPGDREDAQRPSARDPQWQRPLRPTGLAGGLALPSARRHVCARGSERRGRGCWDPRKRAASRASSRRLAAAAELTRDDFTAAHLRGSSCGRGRALLEATSAYAQVRSSRLTQVHSQDRGAKSPLPTGT